MLPLPDLCKVGGIEMACSELPAYLVGQPGLSLSAPVSIQWEGGVMPDEERLAALAQALQRAGFKAVQFAVIRRLIGAGSRRDR
jgi:hypothetical protein